MQGVFLGTITKNFFYKRAKDCQKEIHAIWSYEECWDFSTSEALCTGSLTFPQNTNFPPLFLKIHQI